MSWFFCSSPVNALLRASFVLIHPPRTSFCFQLRATPQGYPPPHTYTRYVGIATSYCSRLFTSNAQRYDISGVVVTRVVAMGFHVCIVSIRRGFDSLLMYLSDLHGFFFSSFLVISSLTFYDHSGESISSKTRSDLWARIRDRHGLSTRVLRLSLDAYCIFFSRLHLHLLPSARASNVDDKLCLWSVLRLN